MALPLLDDEARKTFANELGENFCVSAGAGAGKTTAITERVARMAADLRRDQPDILRRLVVVTYSKLAAEELRVRTRDLILAQLGSTAYGRQSLLADLRGAFFGTIHAFCLKLIGDEGRFLRLPENAELLEEHDEPVVWSRFCQCEALSALKFPPALLERVSRHLSFDDVLETARRIVPGIPSPPFDADSKPPPLNFSEALAFCDKMRGRDKTAEHQARLRLWLDKFNNGAPFLKLPEFSGGSAAFLRLFEDALRPYASWLGFATGSLAGAVARAYQEYRLAQGLMTFADQVYWARELTRQPAVLRRLRARGHIVILDEAQDTDLAMFEVLTEITRPLDAPIGAWPRQRDAPGPEPGRFCFVGDDQQAIHGKRADLRDYRAYVDAYGEGRGGRRLEFSVTMRCPQRVIAAVNAIFASGRIEQQHAEFRALDPRPDCIEGAAWRIELAALPPGEERLNVDDRIYRECVRIADFVQRRGCPGLGIERWSDLAVIGARLKWLEAAAQVFASHRIPGCLISHRALAQDLPPLSWPAALFHVVLHPWDRFELIGVLREIFGVSDVDLARLHRAGALNFLPALREAHQGVPSSRLMSALRLLHDLRAALPSPQGSHATLSRYVEFALEKSALGARLEAIGESAEGVSLFQTQSYEAEARGMTLAQWVQARVDALRSPTATPVGDADAVQFLTPLKAKGLEWPAVIPLALGCAIRNRTPEYPLVRVQNGEATVHLSGLTIDPDSSQEEKRAGEEELQRTLYVTFTRAKNLLIVPDGAALYRGTPSLQQLVRWPELDLTTLFQAAEHAPPPPAITREEHRPPAVFVENAVLLERARAIAEQIPARILPSSLAHVSPAPTPTLNDLSEYDGSAGGVIYGNWWHAAMQHYPWKGKDAERARYRQDQLSRVPTDAQWRDRASAELTRFAQSEAHAEFLKHGAIFLAEMPFSHAASTIEWIEGVMDLVIVTRPTGELWVVDWKTDRKLRSEVSDADFLERLNEKYALQLRAYAGVFARGFQRPVSKLFLYSTAVGELTIVLGSPAAT